MLSFSDYLSLNEAYANVVSEKEKRKYADEVWDILQKSYEKIGGIRGSGFESKESMIKTISFWKLAKKNGKVIAVDLYKDAGGRKLVAMGSDGSPEGKAQVKKMLIDDIKYQRAYGEISDALLHIAKKLLTAEEYKKYFIPAKDAGKFLNKDVVAKDDYTYDRMIGGEMHSKQAFGKKNQGFSGK